MKHESERGREPPAAELDRRKFVTRLAGAAAVVLGAVPAVAPAQDKPAAPAPADPPGTVPNAAVLAEKAPEMQAHS